MALNREEKAAVIEEVSAQVEQAGSIVLAEYRGLTVEKITQLRKQARESGVYLRVLKNTLVRRAVKDTPYEKLADQMVGPLMYGISADPVAPAKLIASFAKANDQLVVKGGAMPNVVMDVAGVQALATMPSREELLAKLLGTMQAPVASFVPSTRFRRSSFAVWRPCATSRKLPEHPRTHIDCRASSDVTNAIELE